MGGLAVGDVFAGFRIEEIVGRGGMGVIYRATELRPQRSVALKVIAPDLAADPDFRARFLRESEFAASIEHPHVVPVLRVGEEDETLFLAMRFIAGQDLGFLIHANGKLDPLRASTIVDQVADALDTAHEQGLVHRDVKPENVLIETRRRGEHAYLTDFGLTKLLSATTRHTGPGMIVGSIDYMAPEQFEGEPVDARTDVYALGCVLYEALTGHVPFPREGEAAKMFAHLKAPIPAVSDEAPSVPTQFDKVIARALAKDPDERFASAGDLGLAALAAVEGDAVTQRERSVAAGAAAPGSQQSIKTRRRTRPLNTGAGLSGPAVPLLERDVPLMEITDAVDRVESGSGEAVFIVGPPGIGKTATLEMAVRLAEARGFRVGLGTGSQMEVGLAFGLISQVSVALRNGIDSVAEGTAPTTQSALFNRMFHAFAGLASKEPLLLCLDDLQWADPDSLTFFGFLCRRLRSSRILALAGLRPEPNVAAALVSDLVGAGLAKAITLEPLSRQAATSLLTSTIRRLLSDSESERLLRGCAGSPLLLKAAASTLDGGGSLPTRSTSSGFGNSLLLDRFTGLGEVAFRYVQSAAVLGVRFQPDVAAELAGLGEDAASAAHSALVRNQLLQDLGRGWAAFVHPLFAQVLLDAQPISERERAHSRAFRLLVDRGAEDAVAAGHAAAAGLRDPLAIEVTTRAGREALQKGALRAASTHLANAVRLAGEDAAADLLLDHAVVLAASERTTEAEQVCRVLLKRSDLDNNLRTWTLVLLARVAIVPGRPRQLEQRYEEAAAAAASTDQAAEAAIRAEAAVTCAVASPIPTVLAATRRALRVIPEAAPAHRALELLHACALLAGGDASQIDLLAREAPRWRTHADRDQAWGWAMAGHAVNALTMLEDLTSLTELFNREFDRAIEAGVPILARLLAVAYADVLYRRARPLEALELVQKTTPPEDWPMSPWSRVALAVLLNEVDRADEARSHVDALRGFLAANSPEYYGQVALWLDLVDARLHLEEGRPDLASDAALHAGEVAAVSGWQHPSLVPWAGVGLEAHVAAGHHDRARNLIAELDDISRWLPARWPRAVAALGRAQVCSATPGCHDADGLFAQALDRFEEWALPLDHAEALVIHGRYLRHAGKSREARNQFRRALGLVEDTESRRLLRVVRAELATTDAKAASAR